MARVTEWVFALFVIAVTSSPSAVGDEGPDRPRKPVDYSPGVRLDWSHRRVELDGRVVLREGMLELFACTPNTREHESIVVVVPAQPIRIFEALGLIGLTPGQPVRFEESTKTWLPPRGDRVRIEIRWDVDGQTRVEDIGQWMRDVATKESLPPGAWVFAGSVRTSDGRLGAEFDGTIVAVVDFPTALLALPVLQPADNALLNLQAHTESIPPLGTPVTLLISAVESADDERKPIRLKILSAEEVQWESERLSKDEMRKRLFPLRDTAPSIVVEISKGVSRDDVERILKSVADASDRSRVKIVHTNEENGVDRSESPRDSDRP